MSTDDFYARVKHQPSVEYSYECGRCNGAGYLRYQRPTSSPLFGKITACPDCRKGEAPVEMPWQQ